MGLAGRVIVRHAGGVVADLLVREGYRQPVADKAHLTGSVGACPIRELPPPPV